MVEEITFKHICLSSIPSAKFDLLMNYNSFKSTFDRKQVQRIPERVFGGIELG